MVEHNSLRKKSASYWRELNTYGIYKNMKGCILEASREGQGGNQDCLPFC